MYAIDHCLVIGAGISGLLVARHLQSHGVKVTLIDKGRRPGGRLATRHLGDATFDHGAQFITTRDRAFRQQVESWLSAGAVKPWYKGPLGNARYVGQGGMANLPGFLARDLDLRPSEKVTYIRFEKQRWHVTSQPHGEESTRHHEGDFLILTAPVPQSISLIDESNVEIDYDAEEELKRIQYTKCITVLAQLNGPAGLPQPGAMDLNLDVLRWIGDNTVKQLSKVPGSLTINSSPRFAEQYWDAPDEVRVPLMLKAAKPFIRADVVSASAHRWGFSEPKRVFFEKRPFRKDYLLEPDIRLGMCGDGFNGGRVEAAALSGMHLAEELTRAV
ncbi:MAG: NAD(P)/FAD-dependent oxidoreductase [Verrucomicrobiota bacterium]